MGAISWTKDQERVIKSGGKNILVSAAAGSGKTAVLVERIIRMISDEKRDIDIDSLLIVTFTNAAAGEIRERIGAALEERLEQEPDNAHLSRQLALLPGAWISTIHGFCLYVIRNYFHFIDLDPGFRIGDENELEILQAEVYEKLIEESYEEGQEAFLALVETYSSDKSDAALEEMVKTLYEQSLSHPQPVDWLRKCLQPYETTSVERMLASSWMTDFMDDMHNLITEHIEIWQRFIEDNRNDADLEAFIRVYEMDIEVLQRLLVAKDYDAFYTLTKEDKLFARNPAVSKKDLPEVQAKKRQVQNKRKNMLTDKSKGFVSLFDTFFSKTAQETWEELVEMKPVVQELIRFTIEFGERYRLAKEEKGLIDFSDQEHFTLQILTEEEEGKRNPSAVALELREQIKEIIIDEYQDSNQVQETILQSVSRVDEGKPNIFMVGDVKQSIYRFRMANPELFNEKYRTYSGEEDSLYQKIELQQNFRSRKVVLDNVNYIFRHIMRKELGNIQYDDKAALYHGLSFPDTDKSIADTVELHVLEKEKGISKEEMEVRAIIKRIRELTGKDGMYILERGTYRKVEYGDITILLRSPKGWTDVFKKIFKEEGIPLYSDMESGYFSAMEIQVIFSLLKIIDNPRQDIPLAAVLRSEIGGFTDDELAVFGRKKSRGEDLWDAFLKKLQEDEKTLCDSQNEKEVPGNLQDDKELSHKMDMFMTMLQDFRKKAAYANVYELLQYIYEKTAYPSFVSAMADGERRIGNLRILAEKALSFEAIGGRGLFAFLNYIDELVKREKDFGEYVTEEESRGAVRIMSIHKSKGLEFPVVFVAGMGRKFNDRENTASFCCHPDYGIGTKYLNLQTRCQSDMLPARFMQRKLRNESHGEELRVLYVALTRAREKLIMTGVREKAAEYILQTGLAGEDIPVSQLERAGCYLDWLLPACAANKAYMSIFTDSALGREERKEALEEHIMPESLKFAEETGLRMFYVTVEDIMADIQKKERDFRDKRKYLLQFDCETVYDSDMEEAFVKELNRKNEWVAASQNPVKVSVSALKHADEEAEDLSTTVEQKEAPVPSFGKKEAASGAAIGTLYHTVLEHLDYLKIAEGKSSLEEHVETELARQVTLEVITEEEGKKLQKKKLVTFLSSSLGKRMTAAAKQGSLKREQAFVIGVPATELPAVAADTDTDEQILVQGIIDAYIEEEDGLILIDYKTDSIRKGEEEKLVERYRTQLMFYEKALTMLTEKKVKEKILYSLALGKEIEV